MTARQMDAAIEPARRLARNSADAGGGDKEANDDEDGRPARAGVIERGFSGDRRAEPAGSIHERLECPVAIPHSENPASR